MSLRILTLMYLTIILIVSAPSFGQLSKSQENDPDMPPGSAGTLNRQEYVRLRSEYIARLRGYPYNGPGNPRARAIRQMEMQQKNLSMRRDITSTATWTPLGPAPVPIGQTTAIEGPVTGRISAIAINPANPNIVYAGAASGGVFRSTNGGATWVSLFDNALSLAIGCIVIDPLNYSTVFVGTGEANLSLDSFFGVGLYIIKNADTSPQLLGPFNLDQSGNDIFTYRSISSIVVCSTNDNIVFCGTSSGVGGLGGDVNPDRPDRGLYRTMNAMSADPRFTKLDLGEGSNTIITSLVAEPGNPNNLSASVYGQSVFGAIGGIFRTIDALDSIPEFNPTLLTGDGVNVKMAGAKVASRFIIYAATSEGTGALHQSTDGGLSWSDTLSAADGFCTPQCWYDVAVAVDQADTNRVYLGGSWYGYGSGANEFKYSTDGGNSFENSDAGLHADVHAVEVAAPPNDNILYFGCDGGIWKSTDYGINWINLNTTGLNSIQFQSLAVHPTDAHFTIGGTQDNGTEWMSSSKNWGQADQGDGGYSLIDQNATDTTHVTMYHTYYFQTGGIAFAATDSLQYGWHAVYNGIGQSDDVLFYAPIALGPGNPNTLYLGTNKLYRSTDKGGTMHVMSQAPISNSAVVSAIGISPQNDSVRLVGLNDGSVYGTMHGSSTLTNITGSIPSYYVTRVKIDPNTTTTGYVILGGFGSIANPLQHIWKTTNLSASPTWLPASTGLPDVPVNGFAIDPQNSNFLYAGTDIGVYVSTNGGGQWYPYGTGLPKVAVFDAAIQPTSRLLRIATHGRGMWEIPLLPSQNQINLALQVSDKWNLISNPLTVLNDSVSSLFKNITSSAFGFTMASGYVSSPTTEAGKGYWLKFNGAQSDTISGTSTLAESVTVKAGWNIIGSISSPVATGNITSAPGGIVTSFFFGYANGYVTADTIKPGQGYWVKVNQDGKLFLSSITDLNAANRIKIVPTSELPPAPPDEQYANPVTAPQEFSLEQNYPNPFNPSTNFGMRIAARGLVTLKVYNTLGEEIATVVNREMDPGSYTIQWDASGLPSGIYYYRMTVFTASNSKQVFSDVKKLLLMK